MMINSFNFFSNFNTVIGNGTFRKIDKIIKKDGFKNPLFIVDKGFSKSELWKIVNKKREKVFKKKNLLILSSDQEPTYTSLNETLLEAKKFKFDVIAGVGGGSCMDTSKAIAALINNPGKPLKYRGFDKLKNKSIPTILIPTTAGTGSEASHNASFVDTRKKLKMGINGKNMFAYKSILDGEVTVSCPKISATSSAVDAMVHILEAYVSKKANTFSDLVCEKAFELIINSIDEIYLKRNNLNKRLNLLMGSFLAGIAQMNAGSGVAACISYPLSVYFKVPHGIGGGIFIIDVMKFNIKKGKKKYLKLSKFLPINSKQKEKKFIKFLERLFEKLNVPKNLKKYDIDKKHLEFLIKIMQPMQKGFNQNPIKFTVSNEFKKMIVKYL